MAEDCFGCIRDGIEMANKKSDKPVILILDELNSFSPRENETTETQTNRIITKRKITKQNKRRGN